MVEIILEDADIDTDERLRRLEMTVKRMHDREQQLQAVPPGFFHYAGKTLEYGVKSAISAACVVGAAAYLAMSLAYGPYDTGKVIYAELVQDKSVKHREIEYAKRLYAGRLYKTELDGKDVINLYRALDVVPIDGKAPTEDDVSWYNLLDWIEDNEPWF